MNLHISTLAFLSLSLISASSFAGGGRSALQPGRCGALGDSLGSQAELDGRFAWAKKCYPSLEPYWITWQGMNGLNGRPLYPTFGVFNAEGIPQNPKRFNAPTSGDAPCNAPKEYDVVGVCEIGCYTGDQNVAFPQGNRPIGDADHEGFTSVVTLAQNASFENPITKSSPVVRFTKDIADGQQKIVVIRTESGGQLKVTENHPLLSGDGKMKDAASLKVGESLVRADGTKDAIASIQKVDYFGKTYNVDVASKNELEQVVIAEGYLAGAVAYQNEWVGKLNRVLLRHNLPANVVR